MNSVAITAVVIPGIVSALLFLVFTYLHEQSHQPYFRAWQLAWAAYSLHYVLDALRAHLPTKPASSVPTAAIASSYEQSNGKPQT